MPQRRKCFKGINAESVRVEDTGSEFRECLILLFDNGLDARFHIPINDDLTLGDTLYKNPIADRYLDGGRRHNPAHFDTRKLDPNAKDNAALLAELIETVRRENMIGKARAAKAEKARIDAERSAIRRRLHHVRELGPQLLDVIGPFEPLRRAA